MLGFNAALRYLHHSGTACVRVRVRVRVRFRVRVSVRVSVKY